MLLSYTGPVRPQACLALLVIVLGAGTAPAEPAPHPWGIGKFLTRYGMWEGCKKGARVRHRVEVSAVAAGISVKRVRETDSRLVKIEEDAYVFEEGEREFDKDGKAGPWKRKRISVRRVKKRKVEELGQGKYRLHDASLGVRRLRVRTGEGEEEQVAEFWVHEDYGVVRASMRAKDQTADWRLVRLVAECKVGAKKLVCREYTHNLVSHGVKFERRVFLSDRVPGYLVRAEYSLLPTRFVEQLLTFGKPK